MRHIQQGLAIAAALLVLATPAAAGEAGSDKALGSTATRPHVPLDSHAMNAMLRADRDKDGTLSREELEHYDVSLARRFKDVDSDRDGKLTLYEFEKLIAPDANNVHTRR